MRLSVYALVLALGLGPVLGLNAAEKTTCGFGTSVDFLDTPSEAATQAKKDGKLVFVLHVSGNFEDPRFT